MRPWQDGITERLKTIHERIYNAIWNCKHVHFKVEPEYTPLKVYKPFFNGNHELRSYDCFGNV